MEEVSQFEKPFFRHPFTAIIAGGYFLVLFKSWLSVNNKLHFINILFLLLGPTSSGKTVFVSRYLKHVDQLVKPTIQEIVFCYAIWQPEYAKIRNQNEKVKFVKGLPDFEQLSLGVRRLVVIDDMISELNSQIETMFIRGSHHLSISLMLICQNVFSRVKMFRNLSLNAHYIVCFKQPRDASQILHLARQISPRNVDYVCDSFYKATSEAYGYLLFDCRQETPDILRLRTKIFPDENLVVFIPQK